MRNALIPCVLCLHTSYWDSVVDHQPGRHHEIVWQAWTSQGFIVLTASPAARLLKQAASVHMPRREWNISHMEAVLSQRNAQRGSCRHWWQWCDWQNEYLYSACLANAWPREVRGSCSNICSKLETSRISYPGARERRPIESTDRLFTESCW